MGRFEKIRALLAGHAGGARSFVKTLDAERLARLSWSKVSCVEACPYSYYLQYVKRARLVPEPDYLVKGRLFQHVDPEGTASIDADSRPRVGVSSERNEHDETRTRQYLSMEPNQIKNSSGIRREEARLAW